MHFLLDNKKNELINMTNISSNMNLINNEIDLTKLSKLELLEKCEELGIKKCKSKNKDKLIELINNFTEKNDIYINSDNLSIESDKEEFIIIPKKKMSNKKSINVIDLFCGCGGMSKGLTDAGLNIIAGIDVWDKAINSYKKNFHHQAICQDLTKLPPEKFDDMYNKEHKQVDLIVGGPPCQGFSIAGKRDTKDPRNSLFMEYVKYINYFNPKAFIMENVIGILSMKTDKNEKVIDIILSQLNINYNCIVTKLYASDFEVPQNRRRTIIIGIRKDLNIIPNEPKPILSVENRIPVKNILLPKNQVDLSYYLSEKALLGIQNKKNKAKENGNGFGAQFLDFEKPSFTIPARYWKDGYDALVKYNDTEIRRLTIQELKRIQSFPDDYILEGSKKDIIMQIGNAVACKFAYHLGKYIFNIIEDKNVSEPPKKIKKIKKTKPKILIIEEEIYEDTNKQFIIDKFMTNVKGKQILIKNKHCGSEGHWLETQMGINHNANNEPDILGYEMKIYSSKITFGDFSASEYLFSKKKKMIEYMNNWEKDKNNITRENYIKFFGTPNPLKNNRYSWSGSCVPTYGIWNSCGQMLKFNDKLDLCVYYSFENDNRKDKNTYPTFIQNDIIIAIWEKYKLEQHINKKFNKNGFFICKKINNTYEKICFGKPFDFNYFVDNIKNKNIIFDSGMYQGNSRNYSQFRSSANNFWNILITEEF